jgi:hypothetical protein
MVHIAYSYYVCIQSMSFSSCVNGTKLIQDNSGDCESPSNMPRFILHGLVPP